MKILLRNLLLIVFIFISTSSCTNNNSTKLPDTSGVVKIIKTSAYTVKNEFDKLIPDEPVHHLGYDRSIGMDFSWRIEYFDEFDNIIYQEDYHLNDKGEEEVFRTISKEYYSPEETMLSYVRTEYLGAIEEEKYIRDEHGVLLEMHTYDKGKLFEKVVCTYNEFGQRTKEDFFREKGLTESYQYTYDTPSLTNANIIKEIHHSYGLTGYEEYREEYNLNWSESNHRIKSRRKYYQFGRLLSDLVTNYESYVGNIATKEITEGYNLADTTSNDYIDAGFFQEELFRTTRISSLNSKGDITRYRWFIQNINRDGQVIENILDMYHTYECEYTYNEKKDWIKVILSIESVPPLTKYIIIREITYIDEK